MHYLKKFLNKCNLASLVCVSMLTVACTPTVAVQAPDKPIVINLNVNIEHKVRVEIDKDLESAYNKNNDIF